MPFRHLRSRPVQADGHVPRVLLEVLICGKDRPTASHRDCTDQRIHGRARDARRAASRRDFFLRVRRFFRPSGLGLIFLKYISDAFEERRAELLKEPGADPEDRDEYLAENVFWVPKQARWSYLQAKS